MKPSLKMLREEMEPALRFAERQIREGIMKFKGPEPCRRQVFTDVEIATNLARGILRPAGILQVPYLCKKCRRIHLRGCEAEVSYALHEEPREDLMQRMLELAGWKITRPGDLDHLEAFCATCVFNAEKIMGTKKE